MDLNPLMSGSGFGCQNGLEIDNKNYDASANHYLSVIGRMHLTAEPTVVVLFQTHCGSIVIRFVIRVSVGAANCFFSSYSTDLIKYS